MTPDDALEGERVPDFAFVESATWEQVGRDAVAGELVEARYEVDGVFRELEEALRDGGQVDERQVRDARMALNQARRVLEEHVAVATDGTSAWGEPVPDMPYGVYREVLET